MTNAFQLDVMLVRGVGLASQGDHLAATQADEQVVGTPPLSPNHGDLLIEPW